LNTVSSGQMKLHLNIWLLPSWYFIGRQTWNSWQSFSTSA